MTQPALTARQEQFAQTFALTRSVADSYRAAYEAQGLSAKTVDKRGREVLNTPAVDKRIRELMNLAAGPSVEILAKAQSYLWDIVNADVNEVVALKIGCCRYCHGEGHRYQWREHEYLDALDKVEHFNRTKGSKVAEEALPEIGGGFGYDETAPAHPDCPNCHGEGTARPVFRDTEGLSPAARAIYGGVQMTNNGLKVILADKMKAIEMLVRMHGGFNDNSNVKLSGDLKALVGVAKLDITDPNAAARAYQDMIAGRLTASSSE